MDLFMPAERVLYDRAYYLSDEAEKDYASEVAEEHGIDVGEVLSSDELMDEVHDALERHIDIDLDDEIGNFDSMLRELKRGDDPEHPAEISVVAKGTVERWDKPSRGLGRVDFSGLGYGWGTQYPDSLSVDAIGIDHQSGERNAILNFSPITHAVDVDGRKFFCHETTIAYDRNADSWSGATVGPEFWTFDGEEAREFAESIGFDRLAARACVQLGIDAPGLKGREALPIPKAVDVAPEPSSQAEAAKAAAGKKLSGKGGSGKHI